MNFKKRINIGVLVAASALTPAVASAQQIHPITQAMLDGYEQLLSQNPDDWFTLYERASQYYRLNDYDKALADILHALRCTPEKEKDQIASERSLAADIYTQTKEYDKALEQIDAAIDVFPGSYPLLYQKGNICMYLGRTDEARKCFQSMLRLKSRSQEALFGLAKCAVLDGDSGEAHSYMDQAEKIDPSNYITYCRLGDLYADMDEIQNAAANYLSAFSLNSRDDRSLSSLLALGKRDYPAVAEALDYAISKTSNTVPLLFLKGNIAKETSHIADAYDAYSRLMKTPEGGAPEVLATMAEICRDNNSLTEALGYADRTVSLSPKPKNLLLKASLEYDLKNYAAAAKLCDTVLASEAENADALLLAALCALASEDNAKASDYLNLAVNANPLDIRPLLLRGMLAKDNNLTTLPGNADFVRAAHLVADTDEQLVYKAIAQAESGKSLDASETMKTVMDKASTDPQSAYLTALFHVSTGNIAKGKEALENARKLGFDNKYLLETYSAPVFSIAPLR